MHSIWRQDHPLWQAAHRPFFLGAGLCAALAPVVWLVPLAMGPEPIGWHRHELLFGAGGAALGGYLLTALPAWTGRASASPQAIRLLTILWLAGRVGFAISLPHPFLPVIAASYFVALGGILLQHVCAAKAWGKAALAGSPFILAAAQIGVDPEFGLPDGQILFRMLPLFFALLVSVVGGRAIPAFTRHWLEGRENSRPHDVDRWISRCAITALLAAVVCLVVQSDSTAGLAMLVSAVLQILRIVSWRSWRTWRYPALMTLHMAWLWLPLGMALFGLSQIGSADMDIPTALHSLTMGTMGTMMFAIMGRAAMERSVGRLLISPEFALGFGCVHLSVLFRLIVPVAGVTDQLALLLSGILWMAGWAIFVWNFRHALRGDVRRPVLSAPRVERAAAAVRPDGI